MGMTFPVIAELEEGEMETVTGDITKAVEEEEVVTATITQEEAMKTATKETEEVVTEATNTPAIVDIADMTKKLTALK